MKFLTFVEIKTKITSVLTFLFVLTFFWQQKLSVDIAKTLLFFCGMFVFDLTATAINNYNDTKKNGQALTIERKKALFLMILLFVISTAIGFWLVALTDIFVLILGGICFMVGVLYSYGPVPFSHTPLGEILSGFFYGFMIPLILFYINLPELFMVNIIGNNITFVLSAHNILSLLLLSVIPFCLTANIMLANNICDLEQDKAVGRYTLPAFIGKKAAVGLFVALYIIVFATIPVCVLLERLHPITILCLGVVPFVWKKVNLFIKHQSKRETFVVSVFTFVAVLVPLIALNAIGTVLQ